MPVNVYNGALALRKICKGCQCHSIRAGNVLGARAPVCVLPSHPLLTQPSICEVMLLSPEPCLLL